MNTIKDAIMIITGAASGIGRALAIQASQKGAKVIATDIDKEGLSETAQMAGDIQTAYLDMADAQAIKVFAEHTLSQMNNEKLILVNNAGVGLNSGNFNDTALEDMEWLMNINYWGVVRMCKALYPYFLQQNQGTIANVSSIFGIGAFSFQSAYSSSKFAVRGFTEVLRIELIGSGVHTLCIHPGGIKTNITLNSRHSEAMKDFHLKSAKRFEKAARTSPEQAASEIIRAIEQKKERLLIGNDAKQFDKIIRLFPVKYSAMLKEKLEKAFGSPYYKK